MKTYEFTLVLSGIAAVSEEAANALYEAGCADGTFCARNGLAYVHFDRDAGTLEEALQSAIANVRAAGFDVARVESDDFTTISRFNEQLARSWS